MRHPLGHLYIKAAPPAAASAARLLRFPFCAAPRASGARSHPPPHPLAAPTPKHLEGRAGAAPVPTHSLCIAVHRPTMLLASNNVAGFPACIGRIAMRRAAPAGPRAAALLWTFSGPCLAPCIPRVSLSTDAICVKHEMIHVPPTQTASHPLHGAFLYIPLKACWHCGRARATRAAGHPVTLGSLCCCFSRARPAISAAHLAEGRRAQKGFAYIYGLALSIPHPPPSKTAAELFCWDAWWPAGRVP